jgi:hypothetical protein
MTLERERTWFLGQASPVAQGPGLGEARDALGLAHVTPRAAVRPVHGEGVSLARASALS